ncbi:sulfurtransferase [Paenibacillus brasilensis]|uniref:Thiosulfate/3-mercaptopyruvate sulfurtransferase n=1 Tax=Paenibacillus brasilensis TaxID=128574 RepID=A0ABU0L438_9BACL|nr:sulfurtransferase [Paenibacillus brasilensis]MDQ0496042.1 thiosulfate/3-mercaptopyruvate sulfurtransferase [Paenibacillus brasilensis]
MKSIVSKRWLLARLYEPDMIIADCRSLLGQAGAGRAHFNEDHIPGAVHFDLEEDLTASLGEHGGRHPLPDVDTLAARLSRAGINSASRIVAYDDQGGMMASRFWWLLRYLGHEQVYVLEEGYSAWKEAKFPVTADQPIRIPSTFTPNVQAQMLTSMQEVQRVSEASVPVGSNIGFSPILVDSRERPRYLGLEEPIDQAAGHIPGAVNFFWKEVLDEKGAFKNAEQLKQHFSDLDQNAEIIVYCGSGVSACPNVLALKEAGFSKVRLYPGSWSDWISYEENPVATGKE